MNYKESNITCYNKYSSQFKERTGNYLHNYILEDANLFVDNLQGSNVLDLGSGPGRDSIFFKERGLNPLCLDNSIEMISLCEESGLNAEIGDIENLKFEENSFGGVWAYTSLLHFPKKNLPKVFSKIKEILKPDGIFYLGMKEGDFEGWNESDKYPNMMRFFSLYKNEELRPMIEKNFNIFHTSRVELGDAVFLNYMSENLK
ncbi:SAM-dependent methyltransferase [archaeon]|nr:SAM-dependent methyltransferase [archaeon]|tara:strand:- start:2983 stop:3588 length:606 start_codon:yes stop_codon:yes gene_type:complete